MVDIVDLGARVLRRLGVAAVADAEAPPLTTTTSVTDIASRALQGLGIIVPASARPSVGPASAAQIAARALQNLGIVVPSAERPVDNTTVTVADLAARALQALDVPVPAAAWPLLTDTVDISAIGINALIRLGVIALDESPALADQTLAESQAFAVHETLVQRGLVSWDDSSIPRAVSQDYALLTALQLATSFGKQGDPSQRPVIEGRIGWQSLLMRAQALAETRVTAIHAGLLSAGLIGTTSAAIPASVAEPYTQILMVELAPVFGKQADPGRLAQWEGQIRRDSLVRRAQSDAVGLVSSVHARLVALGIVDWTTGSIPASVAEDYAELIANNYRPLFGAPQDRSGEQVIEARIRHMAMVSRAQALAETRVAVVHDTLVAQGNASWLVTGIPQAVADEYAGLVAQSIAPTLGQAVNPKMIEGLEARVRRAAMVARGPELAEQAVRDVHADLEARGKTRWTLQDLPQAAVRPYVFLAAYTLAPEFDVRQNENDRVMAVVDLARLIALPSSGERVRAEFY